MRACFPLAAALLLSLPACSSAPRSAQQGAPGPIVHVRQLDQPLRSDCKQPDHQALAFTVRVHVVVRPDGRIEPGTARAEPVHQWWYGSAEELRDRQVSIQKQAESIAANCTFNVPQRDGQPVFARTRMLVSVPA